MSWWKRHWVGDEVEVGFYSVRAMKTGEPPDSWHLGVIVRVEPGVVFAAVPNQGFTDTNPNEILKPERIHHIRRPQLPFKPSRIDTIEAYLNE